MIHLIIYLVIYDIFGTFHPPYKRATFTFALPVYKIKTASSVQLSIVPLFSQTRLQRLVVFNCHKYYLSLFDLFDLQADRSEL